MQTVAETAKLQLAEFLLSIAGGGLWVCVCIYGISGPTFKPHDHVFNWKIHFGG